MATKPRGRGAKGHSGRATKRKELFFAASLTNNEELLFSSRTGYFEYYVSSDRTLYPARLTKSNTHAHAVQYF